MAKVTQHPQITILKANPSDCDDLAEIELLAFKNDPNSPAFHPERAGCSDEELLAVHKPFVSWAWKKWILGETITLKATIPVIDDCGKRHITTVGLAAWINPSNTRLYKLSLREWLLQKVIYPLQEFIFRKKEPSPLPPVVKETMKRQYDALFGSGGVAEGQKPWYLHLLAIHPKWQGIGAGGALLDWGLEKAREDNAPTYLESR